MITTLLLSSALAGVPAGFTEVKRDNDCVVYKGPAEADGVIPIFAACDWADVQPAKLNALQYDWEGHAKVFSTVKSSKITKTEGEKSLVHQVHAISGVSDREVSIWMWRDTVPGGFQYNWKSDGPMEPAKGNVATARHEGFWRVTERPEGGSHVEYELIYDPGGSVPGFLVRWFQTSGTITTTQELRAAAK
ncbi:MAG: SRPBCC family protein [Myxococcota bacterium]